MNASIKKRAVFWLISIFFLLLLTDTLLYFGLRLVGQKKNIFYANTKVEQAKIDNWLANSYDPSLGWKLHRNNANNLGARRNTDYPAKAIYDIKTFGDSFTMGAEVTAENTWQAFIEKKTGWDCLNFGVGAYGSDQALLSYKQSKIKSRIVILGLLCENIGRVVSVYPAWYMRQWFPPKPRFIKSETGWELLKMPIDRKAKAALLQDVRFVNSLKSADYWPGYYENQLKAPAKLRWPALFTILRHGQFFMSRAQIVLGNWWHPDLQSELQIYKYTHLYKSNTEALQIMKFIIDEFVATAKQRSEKPVVILFSDQFSIDIFKKYGYKTYQPLVDYLKQNRYKYLDVGEIFSHEKYQQYFNYYNSHYSPAGNERVAEAIIQLFRSEKKSLPSSF